MLGAARLPSLGCRSGFCSVCGAAGCWARWPSQAGPWVAHGRRVHPRCDRVGPAGAPPTSSWRLAEPGRGPGWGGGQPRPGIQGQQFNGWVRASGRLGPALGSSWGSRGWRDQEGAVDRRGLGTRERVHSAPRGWLLKERGPRGSSVGSPVPSAEMKHWGQAGGGQDLSAGKAGAGLHVAWGGWAPRGMEWGGHQASHPQDRRRLWLEGLCGHVGTMSTGTLDLERAPSRIWRLEPWRLGLWAGLPGVTGGPQTTAGDGARTQHPEREGQ